MTNQIPLTIAQCFAEVDDPRRDHLKRHRLIDLIIIAIGGVISGADSWGEIEAWGKAKLPFLRPFLELPAGIPSHDPFGRVFALLDPEQFQRGFMTWITTLQQITQGEIIAIDGKTLVGSHDHAHDKAAVHLIRAWAAQNHLVLGQRATDTKSKEITAIPQLLRVLDIRGCTVTIDAMGCQKAIAKQIVTQGGDYVLALKVHHPTLHQEVQETFNLGEADDYQGVVHMQYQQVSKNHGRLESRRAVLITEPEYLAHLDPHQQWGSLRAIGLVESERQTAKGTSIERRYYLTTHTDAQQFAEAVQGHWGIENCLHWVLDVVFHEDQSRIRTQNADQNIAVLRHIALNLLRQEPGKGSIRVKRKRAGWDDIYLRTVLGF
jgi:predicted transposase YbfD/YdcC